MKCIEKKDFINKDIASIQVAVIKEAEDSQLDKEITLPLLLMFGLPTIFAMIVMGTFNIIDGIFAARRLGEASVAAITVVTPFAIFALAIGILFASGGAALVAKKKGMKKEEEARQNFTLICIVAFIVSILISSFAVIFPETLLELLGTNYEFMEYGKAYIQVFALGIPLLVISQVFNQFMIADGKPMLSMGMSLLGSVISAGLNAIFLFVMNMGIAALGWATLIGFIAPTLVGLYVFSNRKGTLYFVRPKWDVKALGQSVLNGTGGALGTLATAVITIVMNNVLVRMDGVGLIGVAVAGIVMAIHSTMGMIFAGYLAGTGPLISYNYGNKNHDRQKLLFKYNLKILAVISAITIVGTLMFSDLLARIYFPVGTEIHTMIVRGVRITALSFTVAAFNAFAAGHFAALNKGFIGGILSIVRSFGFHLPLLLILPIFFDLTGIWIALPATEGLTIILSIFVLLKMGKRYHYL